MENYFLLKLLTFLYIALTFAATIQSLKLFVFARLLCGQHTPHSDDKLTIAGCITLFYLCATFIMRVIFMLKITIILRRLYTKYKVYGTSLHTCISIHLITKPRKRIPGIYIGNIAMQTFWIWVVLAVGWYVNAITNL